MLKNNSFITVSHLIYYYNLTVINSRWTISVSIAVVLTSFVSSRTSNFPRQISPTRRYIGIFTWVHNQTTITCQYCSILPSTFCLHSLYYPILPIILISLGESLSSLISKIRNKRSPFPNKLLCGLQFTILVLHSGKSVYKFTLYIC